MADKSKASDVAARYAQALYDLARHGDLAAVEADLTALAAMVAASADLRALIGSPAFTAAQQGQGLTALAREAKFTGTTQKFLGLLAHNRRAGALTAVIAAFRRLAAEGRGSIGATVTTAVAMSKEQAAGVAQALSAALGKQPDIETRIDPAILGGLKVQVGSRLYDASLKAKLDSMKFALKRA